MPERRGRAGWPWVVLLVAAGVTGLAAYAMTGLETEVDFVATVPDHDGLDAYRDLLTRLDGVRFIAIYMAHDPGSGTDHLRGEAFDALVVEQDGLEADLTAAFPAGTFSHSLSVVESMRAGNYMLAKIATAGNPPAGAYALPSDPVTYDLVKQQVLGDDTLDPVLAVGGESALMLFFVADDDETAARDLAGDVDDWLRGWAQDPDHHLVTQDHAVSGLLWASHYTDETNRKEMALWGPIAAGAAAIVLVWASRRISNAAIAIVAMGAAVTWTFGLMAVSGIRISFLTFVLAPLIVGVGVDYAVHLLHRYEEERSLGHSQPDAISRALRKGAPAIALTAVTTAAGLAVLLLVPAPLFAQIGGVAALGIVAAFLAAVTVVPALRSVIPAGQPRKNRDRVGPALRRTTARLRAWPVPVLVIVLAITVVAGAAAASFTKAESGSSENEFPQDDPIIALQQRIEAEYGAFQRAYLVVRGDLEQPDVLLAMHQATEQASTLPLFRDAGAITDLLLADDATDDGAADIIVTAVQGPTGTAPSEEERLPRTAAEARERLDALDADPLWRTLTPFLISDDRQLAVVAITINPWPDQTALLQLRDALTELAEAVQSAIGSDYDVDAAGAPMNRAAIVEQTPRDVWLATAGVTGVVVLVLGIAWIPRRGWSGLRVSLLGGAMVALAALWLVASIPALDGTYDVLHGWGAPDNNAALNDMFLIAFAITVAVGVDDLVHLAHRYWENMDGGANRGEALGDAFATVGRAITGTTATTFTAFAVLSGIYFLQSRNLAILTAVGVLYAYFLTLTVAPWVLAGRPRPDEAAQAPDSKTAASWPGHGC